MPMMQTESIRYDRRV